MSDIFISYSKGDHALALKLSAFLESEGWSVWLDKSLAAADLYRDEIMKQLAAAHSQDDRCLVAHYRHDADGSKFGKSKGTRTGLG